MEQCRAPNKHLINVSYYCSLLKKLMQETVNILLSACSTSMSFLPVFLCTNLYGWSWSFFLQWYPVPFYLTGSALTHVPALTVWSISASWPDWVSNSHMFPLGPVNVRLPPGFAKLDDLKPQQESRALLGKSLFENEPDTRRKAEWREGVQQTSDLTTWVLELSPTGSLTKAPNFSVTWAGKFLLFLVPLWVGFLLKWN